jgi:hypothetical protein
LERIHLEEPNPKFEVGQIVITPAASAALAACGKTLGELLARHCAGDWGDVSERARSLNERGLIERFNLQSIYRVPSGEHVVVQTNPERTLTMIHLERAKGEG